MWQFDFSEYETASGGKWQIGGTVDYWSKTSLSGKVATTQRASDMILALETAIAQAEALLDLDLADDCVDTDSGKIEPIVVVTDNGSAMKSVRCSSSPASTTRPNQCS